MQRLLLDLGEIERIARAWRFLEASTLRDQFVKELEMRKDSLPPGINLHIASRLSRLDESLSSYLALRRLTPNPGDSCRWCGTSHGDRQTCSPTEIWR